MTGSEEISRRWHLWLIVLAGVLAYHNSFDGIFVNDDLVSIVLNPHVRSLWPLSETIRAPHDATTAGRPVVAFTVALNFAAGALDPWGYHAFNLAVHLAAALALYGLTWRVLSAGVPAGCGVDRARGLALAATLLWTVHPLQTESVTYIIQRAESLVSLFFLLTLYGALRSHSSPRPRLWWCLAVVACALGMATKEVMAGAPLLVVLLDRTLLFPTLRETWRARRGLYLALGSTWLILAACVSLNARPESAGFSSEVPSSWEYARSQCVVIPHYLRLVFWPHPQVFHYDWPVSRSVGESLPGAILLLGLAGATVWGLRRRPELAFWGALFFVALAPSSSVVPIMDLAVEHRMYLALAGVIVPTVVGLDALWTRGGRSSVATSAAGIGLAAAAVYALLVLTTARNLDYRDTTRIWQDCLTQSPTTARGFNRHGVILSRLGRYEEAMAAYRKALDLNPVQDMLHLNLGTTLFKMGRIDEAEKELLVALRLDRANASVHERLGTLRLRQGKVEEARAFFQEAIRLEPYLGASHYGLGLILEHEGKFAEAIEEYRAAQTPWSGRAAVDEHLARLLQGR